MKERLLILIRIFITNKKLVLLLAGLTFSSSQACIVENGEKDTQRIFVSKINDKLEILKSGSVVSIKSCQRELQIATSLVLPSPQDFSTEYWMSDSVKQSKSCDLKSDISNVASKSKLDSQSTISKHHILSSCFGVRILSAGNKAPGLNKSINCQRLNSDKANELLLKGDNCMVQFDQVNENYYLSPFILPECASLNELTDFNSNLKIIQINNKSPEVLTAKDYHVLFEDKSGAVGKVRNNGSLVNFNKSTQYQLDFDFFSLQLMGSKDLNLNVKSQFFVNNFSHQNLPFVVKNDLALVKAADKSHVQLGLWYNGVVVPGQWMGVDGLSDILNIANSVESYQLNTNVRSIQKGDYLILTAQLSSPNSGYQKYWQFAKEYLQKMMAKNKKATSAGKKNDYTTEIKPIDELKSLSMIQELKEFSLDGYSLRPLALDPRFQIHFSDVCFLGNKQGCVSLDQVEKLPMIKVLFVVEEADFDVKIRPLKMLKQDWDQSVTENILNSESNIYCH